MTFQFKKESNIEDRIKLKFSKEPNYIMVIFMTIWSISCFSFSCIMLVTSIIANRNVEVAIAFALICFPLIYFIIWLIIWNIKGVEMIEFYEDSISICYLGSFRKTPSVFLIKDIKLIGIADTDKIPFFIPSYMVIKKGCGYFELANGNKIQFGQDMEASELAYIFLNNEKLLSLLHRIQ